MIGRRGRATATAIFSLVLLLAVAHSVNVSGSVHLGETLEVVRRAVVEVNTTPFQRLAVSDGKYSFDLPPGTYSLVGFVASNSSITVYDRVVFSISEGQGEYKIDLLLFPASKAISIYDSLYLLKEDVSSPSLLPPEDAGKDRTGGFLLPIALMLAIGLSAALFLRAFGRTGRDGKRAQPKEAKGTGPKPQGPLSEDLLKILLGLAEAGGRSTQREIRKGFPYSEAKASLAIADLEERGLVRKFKMGRGNVVVLTDKGRRVAGKKAP